MPCLLRRQHCGGPPFPPPKDQWWTGDLQGRQWSKGDCARAPLERRRTTWPESVAPQSHCQAAGPNSCGGKMGFVLSYFLQYIYRSYQEYTGRRKREQQGCLGIIEVLEQCAAAINARVLHDAATRLHAS